MILQGSIKNGVVVLKNGSSLPEGTQLSVRAVKKLAGKRPPRASGRRKLLRHAGKFHELPADAARNLNHYLYGHAKS